ncbi:MAG TPA: CHAT domain-containing protein [Thermoanaerobaculia bacterium]|nr:CHAT domain-containing protein [Thermoanaerobaculia bacterium]
MYPREAARDRRLVRVVHAILVAAFPGVFAADLSAGTPQTHTRILIERVESGSTGARAGLRVGDGLESWDRLEDHGEFRSPFDVSRVEVEQGWRGGTRISGFRDDRPIGLSLPSRFWGVSSRPILEGVTLSDYERGRRLFARGDFKAACQAWRSAAARLRLDGQSISALWMESRLAEATARSRDRAATREVYEAAIRDSDELADWWPGVVLRQAYASALSRFGDVRRALGASREARDLVSANAPDSLAIVSLELFLGDLEARHGDARTASASYGRALAFAQQLAPDSLVVADCLAALGHATADRSSAEDFLGRALLIREREDPDSLETARVGSDLGTLLFQQGDILEAERLHQRAYALRRRERASQLELAMSLHWLGNIAWMRGHLASAEDDYRQALAIRRRVAPRSRDVATSLNALGNLEGSRKDPEAAARLHREALEIAEQRYPGDVADLLHNLGEDERLQGHFDAAQALFERALTMHERLPSGSERDAAIASTLVSMAAVARDRGALRDAERLERRALAIRELQESDTLQLAEDREVLADILRKRGDLVGARGVYDQVYRDALRLAPDSELQARAIHAIGRIEEHDGRLARAEDDYRLALDALEGHEGRLGSAPEHRERFSAAYSDYYRDDADALVRLDRPEDAVAVVERSRGRLLREMLTARDLAVGEEAPRELEQERKRLESDYEEIQRRLSESAASSQEAAMLLDRLAEVRTKRRDVTDRITRQSPRYASLRYPGALSLSDVRDALDPGTLLLLYSVGVDRTLLFAVEPAGATGSGLSVYQLPVSGAALRRSVQRLRNVLALKDARPGTSTAAALEQARALYEQLIGPAEERISRSQRLLILPDGPLHTLPWAALVRRRDGRYLVEQTPIHVGVSIAVYDQIRAGRPAALADPAVRLAAFGDPTYPAPVERKVDARRVEDPPPPVVAYDGYRLEPLPASRMEVEAITSLYAPRSVAYLGADATEERAKSIGKDIPIVHFATHAIINERFPLDSALVFTIPEQPKEGQDNGFLQAWEIIGQMRINAELVTLSACDSGLGKEMGGEGLIGLTRAFQYAGARSVLASLWKVEDKTTAELMKRFYAYLKSGKTKDEALRSAQIDLIHSKDHSSPRDWAAFQLNGDWK